VKNFGFIGVKDILLPSDIKNYYYKFVVKKTGIDLLLRASNIIIHYDNEMNPIGQTSLGNDCIIHDITYNYKKELLFIVGHSINKGNYGYKNPIVGVIDNNKINFIVSSKDDYTSRSIIADEEGNLIILSIANNGYNGREYITKIKYENGVFKYKKDGLFGYSTLSFSIEK
jgi:hypothetical protein